MNIENPEAYFTAAFVGDIVGTLATASFKPANQINGQILIAILILCSVHDYATSIKYLSETPSLHIDFNSTDSSDCRFKIHLDLVKNKCRIKT
ncbi:MAG: hypothetical protein N3A65_01645 [candidate division WOR-3 bacterium]|nr:hypothetical protein [candidate division WOR-3 bacterium]